ncbi:unnamed protein product [Allacma fusca]|uniref:Uncharacterized protein n=1 Tax=Allacma fusca TaxID=39272 RepID=A0A8J2J3D2_9HEXA|nr:unnamed protein product [Allacma fusca]
MASQSIHMAVSFLSGFRSETRSASNLVLVIAFAQANMSFFLSSKYKHMLKKITLDGCDFVIGSTNASIPFIALLVIALEIAQLNDTRYWLSRVPDEWKSPPVVVLFLIWDLNLFIMAPMSVSFCLYMTVLYATVNRF